MSTAGNGATPKSGYPGQNPLQKRPMLTQAQREAAPRPALTPCVRRRNRLHQRGPSPSPAMPSAGAQHPGASATAPRLRGLKEGIKHISAEGFKRRLKSKQLSHPLLNRGNIFLPLLKASLRIESQYDTISDPPKSKSSEGLTSKDDSGSRRRV